MAKREYCCVNCGLIWFDEKLGLSKGVICPECSNDGNIYGHDKGLFACDTLAWFYANEAAVSMLKKRGKKIHYHKEHPWYEEEVILSNTQH